MEGRLNQILRAAEKLTLTKNQAQVLVGGRRRLERLVETGRIAAVKKDKKKQNSRLECNAADVLRYTIVAGEMPLPNYL